MSSLRILLVVSLAWLAACPSMTPAPIPPQPVEPPAPVEPALPGEPPEPVEPALPARPAAHITWQRVESPADVSSAPPAPGTWRVHLIDVGTGLALLVQGADFALLYDAGTSDPIERPLRVVAHLAAALGPSGDGTCSEAGAPSKGRRTIDHVVLSHPHQDHASALDLVLHCFDVRHVWDAGRVHHAVFYRELVEAVGRETGATYHTAAEPRADRTVVIKDHAVMIPRTIDWVAFREGDTVALGADAGFVVLHAEAKARPDPNQNSVVLALDLGPTRLLLTGDAESGARADPSAPLGDIEAHLVDHFADLIDADILQVGHHGSATSSRAAFLAAVSPALALVSAGPKRFHDVRLPDSSVLAALAAAGAAILRTDVHDAGCPLAARLGAETGPGGCDSYVITIDARPPAE